MNIDSCAEPPQHLDNHVIVQDAQAILENLSFEVPVAEMPCNTGKLLRIARKNIRYSLRFRLYRYQCTIIEFHTIAILQCHRIGQVEEKLPAGCGNHSHSSPISLMKVEFNRVLRLSAFICGNDSPASYHVVHLEEEITLRHRQLRRRLTG